jgi:replicative DNA helicase
MNWRPFVRALESEQAVIGCALAFPENTEANERLRPEHFSEPVHALIWEQMLSLRARGLCPDPTLVSQGIGGATFDMAGGLGYLANLVDHAMLWSLPGHIEVVADRAMRRALETLAKESAARSQMIDVPALDLLAELERGAAEIGRHDSAPATPVGMDALEYLNAAREGRYRGTSVGLQCIDRITGGIQSDSVWIVGGRTSMGKSIFQTVVPQAIAEQGRGVLMFSLEMPRREVQARLIASMAYDPNLVPYNNDGGNVTFSDLLRGQGTREQRARADNAARKLASLPMSVVDRGGLSLDDIINQSRRQVRAWEKAGVEPGAIIIDHLGLVASRAKRDSKAAEVADTVDRLKAAAKLIGAPIIAAAQINRGPEARNDKRPTMADLNWSGSIEQIADFVCLMYRDAYYLERSPSEEDRREAFSKKFELELIVPKNRSGPTCTLKANIDTACNAIWDAPDELRAVA